MKRRMLYLEASNGISELGILITIVAVKAPVLCTGLPESVAVVLGMNVKLARGLSEPGYHRTDWYKPIDNEAIRHKLPRGSCYLRRTEAKFLG